MKNSSFPSESVKWVGAMALVLVGGATMHWWRDGWSLLPLLWLMPALACLGLWHRANQTNQKYLLDVPI